MGMSLAQSLLSLEYIIAFILVIASFICSCFAAYKQYYEKTTTETKTTNRK
jgi:hypothetical protein